MVLKKTLLIEKKGDYMKRFYKTKSFWISVPTYNYQYWSDWDDYRYRIYDDSYCEMQYIFYICDEENLIESLKKDERKTYYSRR